MTAKKWRHLLVVMPIVALRFCLISTLYDQLFSLVMSIIDWYSLVRKQEICESDLVEMDKCYFRLIIILYSVIINTPTCFRFQEEIKKSWDAYIDVNKNGKYTWNSVKFHAGVHYSMLIR